MQPLEIAAQDLVGSDSKLPAAVFRVTQAGEDFSPGGNAEKTFFDKDMKFESLSIANYMQIPMATERLLSAATPEAFSFGWLARLFCEGTVMYNTTVGEEEAAYVLQVTNHGALVWGGHAEGVGGLRVFVLDRESKLWRQITLYSLREEWKVMVVNVRSPLHAEELFGIARQGAFGSILFELVPSAATSPLEFAATRAFKHMGVAHLQSLLDHLKVVYTGSLPRLLRDLLRVLMEHVLGRPSDELVGALCRNGSRSSRTTPTWSPPPSPGRTPSSPMRKRRRRRPNDRRPRAPNQRAAHHTRLAQGDASSAGPYAPPPPPPPRPRPGPTCDRPMSQEEASRFLPKARGATVSCHSGIRWQVK